MKKIILAAAAATLLGSAASAQISFGPEAGLNLSTLNGKSGGKDINSGLSVGARLGIVADIGITDHIFIRPGIEYSQMGGKNGDLGSDLTYHINYIQIPVNVLYKLGEEGDGRLYFGLTPYFGYALGGKIKSGSNETSVKIGDKAGEDQIKGPDFGLGVKVGYEFPMGINVDAAFLQGFTNNATGGDADNSVKNRLITIGVSYFFGKGN